MKKYNLKSRLFWWKVRIKNELDIRWDMFKAIYIHGVPRKYMKEYKQMLEEMMTDPDITDELRKISKEIIKKNMEK